jgi:hypothetical protein
VHARIAVSKADALLEGMMATQRFLFADVDGFVDDVVNISDALSNLVYLIEIDAGNARLVREYAKQAEQLLQALGSRVHSADAAACAESCS